MYSWINLEHLCKWTHGKWENEAPSKTSIPGISTDSRNLEKGEVFLALKGPNFDGHTYVDQAVSRGAIAAIVDHKVPSPIPQIVVKDTQAALVAIGEQMREAFKGPVIAITGSAGKSSTKEMVADLLGDHTVRSPKSFNNILGVPRTIYLLDDQTRSLVLEIGMNAPGEIAEICGHFKPTCGAITNIGNAHVGKLGGQEKIYAAKKELFDALATQPNAQVALNLDDEWVVKAYKESFKKEPQTVTYSATSDADVRIKDRWIDPESGALTVDLEIRGNRSKLRLSLFGLHQATNIAAASALALLSGLKPKEILERLPALRSTSQRGELITLEDGKTLVDESYNSNPAALTVSLASVAELDPARRRVLVLGEMRELGEFSDSLHEQVGHALVKMYKNKKFPFLLIGVGNGFLPFLQAVERELPGIPCVAVPDSQHATERLKSLILPGDIILVKGSRGIQLETVVQWLKS